MFRQLVSEGGEENLIRLQGLAKAADLNRRHGNGNGNGNGSGTNPTQSNEEKLVNQPQIEMNHYQIEINHSTDNAQTGR